MNPSMLAAATTSTGVSDGLFAVLTAAEAADYLKVSVATLLHEAKWGRIPGREIDDEWRFLKFALAEWLYTGSKPAPAPAPQDRAPPAGDGTPEEQEAFLTRMRELRKEWGTVGGGDGETP